MSLISWHYSQGLKIYWRLWGYALLRVIHYFSLPQLPQSLFSPWKRLIDTSPTTGFNFSRELEKLSFNLISRGIGAVVRIFLFLTGVAVLLLILASGPVGLIFWLIFPPVSLTSFKEYQNRLDLVTAGLLYKIKAHPDRVLATVFSSPAGKFILTHTSLDPKELAKLPAPSLPWPEKLETFTEVIQFLLDHQVIKDEFLHPRGCNSQDLLAAAQWWDNLQPKDEKIPLRFGQPGVGTELLFGYTPTLDNFATDLSTPQSFSSHLIVGRQDLISRMESALLSGNSVVLVGLPGVGKHTVALKFAYRAKEGLLNPKLSYRRILELDYNFLLSETLDINTKKFRLGQILAEASEAGNIILVIKDLHRLTNPQVEGVDFTDVFEQYLDKRDLKIIAISSSADYERFLSANQRLKKYLEPMEIIQPSPKEALDILITAANSAELTKNIIFALPALRQIIDGSDRFITDTPFPEKALDILDELVTYAGSHKVKTITVDHVNAILSQKTAISLTRLTPQDKKILANLETTLHSQLVGQDAAVSLIAKSLRARSLGTKNENRPIGSFLFLGPTGVGKTQTAKALAQVYYGSPSHILRFDMAEYAGFEGLSRLIGSVQQNLPGALTTAIKNRPTSLLLLDEIEKAPPQIYNLLLTLLDEGFITDAFNRKIICQHLFVIATSNAGSEYIRQLVSQGITGDRLQKTVIDYVQKIGTFSPEFLNILYCV